ncbi:MAG TPA: Flp pilus assembly protein CpaB, partial [Reyranella sp.]|nr:Flp pilus assembly protein CpaB [Reyranella sp.]
PGDHVDVVLIQNFNDHELELGHRSVGETVLTNLRVIAIDQTVISDRQRSVDPKTGAMVEPRIAKTVTLEVAPLQAEALMVALQLGNIQLTLRNAGDNSGTPSVLGATWSSDVSPALLELTRRAAETAAQGPEGRSHGSAQGPAQSVQILHGSSIELRCFDGSGRPAADCASPAPDNGRPAAAGGSGPAAGTPAAPGASGGRIAPSARQPNL